MHKVKMEKKHLTKNEILRRYTTPELPGEFQAISGFKKNNKYTDKFYHDISKRKYTKN